MAVSYTHLDVYKRQVAYIFYKIFMFIKDTRAEQVFKGIVVLLLATQPVSYTHLDVYKRQA